MNPLSRDDSPSVVRAGRYQALALLLEAHETAIELGRPAWDFAYQLASLHALGATDSALRWLVEKSYAEHRLETTQWNSSHRTFHETRSLRFCADSCLVLTRSGVEMAHRMPFHYRHDYTEHLNPYFSVGGDEKGVKTHCDADSRIAEVPWWNAAEHTLSWDGRAIKHFKRDAPHQEAILGVFQWRGWVRCVDVTLPKENGVNRKMRLHDAVKNLSRSVKPHLRFHQEGNGNRVSWEPLT
jgi:hypothetical protein